MTEKHVGGLGMSLAALCEATITTSDNAAANLIGQLRRPRRPHRLRTLGDSVTRIDRREPELNVKHPDEPMDTTTPRAMVMNLQRLVLGDALSNASRQLLTKWLVGNTTAASASGPACPTPGASARRPAPFRAMPTTAASSGHQTAHR